MLTLLHVLTGLLSTSLLSVFTPGRRSHRKLLLTLLHVLTGLLSTSLLSVFTPGRRRHRKLLYVNLRNIAPFKFTYSEFPRSEVNIHRAQALVQKLTVEHQPDTKCLPFYEIRQLIARDHTSSFPFIIRKYRRHLVINVPVPSNTV
jgi:hypothetical protein